MKNDIDYPILYDGDENYFFISYSHNSQSEVYRILRELNRSGVRFWYDKGLKKGVDWEKHVNQKMNGSACVLFFFDENFFYSGSLQKEVKAVSDNSLNYCPVYYRGLLYQQLYRKLPEDFILDYDIDDLFRSLFNNKITGIKADKNYRDSIIKEICEEAEKNDAILEKSKKSVVEKTKKIVFLGKNSLFSRSVFEGVRDYFSSSRHIIESHLVDDSALLPLEYAFQDKIRSFINDDSDGVIIRPIGKMNNKTFSLFKELCEKKDVVICDVGLTTEQINSFPKGSAPAYVCSDFELGGRKIASVVNQICFSQGYFNTDVVVCAGPAKNVPANIRSEALLNELHKNIDIIPDRVFLNSLDPEDCFEKISVFFKNNKFSRINNRSLVIYLGNDNAALYFAKNISRIFTDGVSLSEYGRVFILGYDGIVGTTGNSVLEETSFDYATVDTLPSEQGLHAAETLIRQMEGSCKVSFVKVTPKVIKKLSVAPKIENKFSSIRSLTADAGLFILDLDGTIADTETLHWAAYNELMREIYNITLSEENIKKYIGNSEIKIYRMIEKDYDIIINDSEFLKKRLKKYLELVSSTDLKPFKWVEDFFNRYKEKKIALLTSQVPEIVDHLLSFWDLDDIIPKKMRISAHDGTVTKQAFFEHPEKYIELSGNELGNIVVFEDSNHVAKIASGFGYTTIGIRHRYNKNSLKDFTCIIDDSIKKGLFVGLSGIDAIFNISAMPKSDQKVKAEKYRIDVGGPALKAAITCAKLGGNATLITGIGDGPMSYIIKQKCMKYGIELVDIMPDKELPNISFVGINSAAATRDIVSGQSVTADIKNIPDSFYQKYDYCLYDCNFPFFTKELSENLEMYSVPLVLDCGSWKDSAEYALRYAECVISSSSFVSKDGLDIFELKNKYAIKHAARTNGGDPIEFESDGKIMLIPIKKKKNVSTLGAGDVFHGAFCHFYFNTGKTFEEALKEASETARMYVSGEFT